MNQRLNRITGVTACAVLAFSSPSALAAKLSDYTQRRFALYGAISAQMENYQYTSANGTTHRRNFQTKADINARGFIWDPRFATFDGGLSLLNENVRTDNGDIKYNTVGYRLSSSFLPTRPNPFTISASRSKSTVADFATPAYGLTTTNFGMRWGFASKWTGQTSLFYDRARSTSDNVQVPRSEYNLTAGFESRQKLLAKQWGESDLTYGYRRNNWDDYAYGSKQRQNYLYASDRTLFGEKANLTANLTYYNRDDERTLSPTSGTSQIRSDILSLSSALMINQTDSFQHYYNASLGKSKVGETQTDTYSATAGFNYRLTDQWRTNGSVGWNASKSAGPTSTTTTSSPTASGGVNYSDTFGDYLVNGGYNLSLSRPQSSDGISYSYTNISHTVSAGYARRGSIRFADSLDVRTTVQTGQIQGSEQNIRYGVNSQLSMKDTLQGVAEYRRYHQEYSVGNVTTGGTTVTTLDSNNLRFDGNWLHTFSTTASATASVGISRGQSQGIDTNISYVQGRMSAMLPWNIQWTALARLENTQGGFASTNGKKTTVESDINYRIGKWQAIGRYRLRDARLEAAPFKEQSLYFFLKRDYSLAF